MMRKPSFVAAAVAAGVVLLAATQLLAQRPAPQPTPPQNGIALLNFSTVMMNSARLKKSMETWNTELDGKKADLKKEADLGNQLTEKVRSLPEGSPERKKLEQEVAKMRADYELHGKRARDDARERESKILYSWLREFQDDLARYAQANNLQLILRHEPTPDDLSDPRTIYAEFQKPIVYQRAFDTTTAVTEAVNRHGTTASSTNRTTAPPRPVQK
jgi:Skp family chaperone for outer membrane proteins